MSSITQVLLSSIERRDHSIMRRVNKWPAPKWFRLWMVCATRGGDGWLWYSLGLVLLIFGGSAGRVAVAQSGLAAGVGILAFLGLKRAAGRKRPCSLEPHCWSTLLPPDQFSFPSGHTITAFAVCVPLIAHYPNAAPGILFCAFSIAVSRVITGMHFLSDVIAGGLIGCLLGECAKRLF
jgi:undecaprenyl-diphosphatase